MKELQKNFQEETALDACKLAICRKVLAWLFHLYNPIGNEEYGFNPDSIYNYALDRMDGKVEYIEDMDYIDTSVDIDARFDEIIGVTYLKDVEMRDIYFAVKPESVNYIRTKYIHPSQDEVNPETEREFIRRYPSLRDCKFFVISCRPNVELYALFASYGASVIILEPTEIQDEILRRFQEAVENYSNL